MDPSKGKGRETSPPQQRASSPLPMQPRHGDGPPTLPRPVRLVPASSSSEIGVLRTETELYLAAPSTNNPGLLLPPHFTGPRAFQSSVGFTAVDYYYLYPHGFLAAPSTTSNPGLPPPLFTGPWAFQSSVGFTAVDYHPRGFVAESSTNENPARLPPPLYTDPAAFHPRGFVAENSTNANPARLPPPLYTDPAAFQFQAARPTGTVGLGALAYDPRASVAVRYNNPVDLLAARPTGTDVRVSLGLRLSEALRLGNHPPPPIDATAVGTQPQTWVLGASTGDFTTPAGIFTPQRNAGSILCQETQEKVLHDDPIGVVALLMTRESADHAILLLDEEGEEATRVRLLDVVKLHIHKLMENPDGARVFGALLRSCEHGHPDDLPGVVQAFAQRNDEVWGHWIMRRAEDSDNVWMDSVQMLFTAASEHVEHVDLCNILLNCLVRENVANSARGSELLTMCLRTFPYEQSKFLIQQALEGMQTNLHESHFGSRYLQECFCQANGAELVELEEFLLSHATNIAMGQYSHYLIKHCIVYGTDEFRCDILCQFRELEEPDLGELVTDRFGKHVLLTLLESGRRHLPATTRMLADKISMLPQRFLNHPNGRMVMRLIEEPE